MKITKDTVVVMTYELVVDGQIVDTATEERPLDYIQGENMLLKDFENALEGKEAGEEFKVTLSPEQGYGIVDPSRKVELPKTAFEIEGKIHEELLVVGRTIPMLNSIGQVVQGLVTEVKADSVIMDFNHPLAGKTLNFTGKILSVREATEKEISEGLHGEYLPKEGGCGGCGGGCHGGCGGGCGSDEGGCGCGGGCCGGEN